MGTHEGRYNRVLRSHHLAMRMIRLGARPVTVVAWAKITRERAGELAREYRQEAERSPRYLRGPSPTSLSTLLSSLYMRQELSAMGGVCLWVGVLASEKISNARLTIPGIDRGERLCNAVDIFREMVPHSRLTIEQTALLVTALAEGSDCQIAYCPECSAVMLVDPLAATHGICAACEHDAKMERQRPQAASVDDGVIDDEAPDGVQQSLF